MPTISKKHAQELMRIGESLIEIGRSLLDSPAVPESVAKKVLDAGNAGECLGCHEAKPLYRRGNCQSCYHDLMRKIRTGKLSENEAMVRGLLAPKDPGGVRKAKPTEADRLLIEKQQPRIGEMPVEDAMSTLHEFVKQRVGKMADEFLRQTAKGTKGSRKKRRGSVQ